MRILIADHQSKMRFALRITLERQPGLKTIGEASDAGELMAQARAICPDLAIIAWGLPGMPIGELIAALRRCCHNPRVIVLGSRDETRGSALEAGADEYVHMGGSVDELRNAIDRLMDREHPDP
jgi:DNA-binding NarL/FixJ family response regulator